MSAFNHRGVVYAANTTVAALAALLLAFSLGLANPWWAALTVFIASQPMAAASGAVVARALYRILGTLIGGLATLVIVPALADMPALLIAAVAVWTASCVYLSLLYRTPRGYAFMLAGYTVALVGLPLAADPTTAFDNMLLRLEEVAIGAACAAVVHSVVLPRDVLSMAQAKVTGTLADARQWIVGALSPDLTSATERAARRRLAQDLSELHLLAATLPYDVAGGKADMRIVWALEDRLVALLPLLSGIEDRLETLAKDPMPLAALSSHVREVQRWAKESTRADDAELARLLEGGPRALPTPGSVPIHVEALAASVVERLADLAAAWNEALRLAHALREHHHRPDAGTRALVTGQSPRALHVDQGLAAFAGLAVGLAVVLAAAVPVVTGW